MICLKFIENFFDKSIRNEVLLLRLIIALCRFVFSKSDSWLDLGLVYVWYWYLKFRFSRFKTRFSRASRFIRNPFALFRKRVFFVKTLWITLWMSVWIGGLNVTRLEFRLHFNALKILNSVLKDKSVWGCTFFLRSPRIFWFLLNFVYGEIIFVICLLLLFSCGRNFLS